MNRVWRGLTRNRAWTDPSSPDLRLRGRTYAISFDRVWTAALALADGGLRGWTVKKFDDQSGTILAVNRRILYPRLSDVRIHVKLDENAQTRVDLECRASEAKRDLGRSIRAIGGFCKALDRSLGALPSQILDPRLLPPWAHTA